MTKRSADDRRRTWNDVVLAVLRAANYAPVPLSYLNDHVQADAPELVAANPHWRDKIRQVVQRLRDQELAENVSKGVWKAARKK